MLLFPLELFNPSNITPYLIAHWKYGEVCEGCNCWVPSQVFRTQNLRDEAWVCVLLRISSVNSAFGAWLEELAVMTGGTII